jgi:type II secretory ATPase GspE/PulE/Tfp pilus assembly ATPase PilB-like protein
MDAATWLRQMGAEPEPADKRARVEALLKAITALSSLDDVLFDGMDQVRTFFQAERAVVFIPDQANQLRAVAWINESVQEIHLPQGPTNLIGWALTSRVPMQVRNVWDLAELVRLHPRLRPDEHMDQWLSTRLRAALVAPLTDGETSVGVLLIANRMDELGIFPGREVGYAGELGRVLGKRVAEFLGVRAAVIPHPQNPLAGEKAQAPIVSEAEIAGLGATTKPIPQATPPTSSQRTASKWAHLVESGIIPAEALTKALAIAEATTTDPGRHLIEKVGIPRAEVEKSLTRFYGVPFYRFTPKQQIPEDLRLRLKMEFLKRIVAVPIDRQGASLTVVIDDPSDIHRADALRSVDADREVAIHVGFRDEILACIEHSYGVRPDVNLLLKELSSDESTGAIDEPGDDEEEGEESDSAIIKLANQIIIDAFQRGASDIHIEPYGKEDNTRIRFRIDGDCIAYQEIPAAFRNSLVARFKIMSRLDISEKRKPQDGKIKFRMRDRTIELRVATLPTVNGNEDVVMRILAASKPIPLDEMGMSDRNLHELRGVLAKPYGLILCVGPTGSGKTTTLHSALGSINTVDMKIWTAEDPVEITQPGLRQVQVQPKIGFDFATAMRAFLRADPDVIMVGEMRDKETAATGVEASLTGNLVFSTLHTNSAPETITRLVDMGLDPFTFADALLGVLAQRLARGLCKKCREEYQASSAETAELILAVGDEFAAKRGIVEGGLRLWRSKGCDYCGKTGYKGRIAVHELLIADDDVKKAIARRASVEEIRDLSIKGGMTTLLQDGIEKALAGKTDVKQVLAVCMR